MDGGIEKINIILWSKVYRNWQKFSENNSENIPSSK